MRSGVDHSFFFAELTLPIDLKDILDDLSLRYGSHERAISKALQLLHGTIFDVRPVSSNDMQKDTPIFHGGDTVLPLTNNKGDGKPKVYSEQKNKSFEEMQSFNRTHSKQPFHEESPSPLSDMISVQTNNGNRSSGEKTQDTPVRPLLEEVVDVMIFGDE